MAAVYIALGSNLGDRIENLRRAALELEPFVHVTAHSNVYETEPWGVHDQPWFYNAVVSGTTDLAPEPLLDALKGIEQKMGRRESFRYGPRVIDLDLLLYDEQIVHTNYLDLPHPRLAERGFVLRPLADLAPNLEHPVLRRTVRDLLAALPPSEEVRYLRPFSQ